MTITSKVDDTNNVHAIPIVMATPATATATATTSTTTTTTTTDAMIPPTATVMEVQQAAVVTSSSSSTTIVGAGAAAAPASSASAASDHNDVVVLPPGDDIGMVVAGNPPMIQQIASYQKSNGALRAGRYLQTLIVPGVAEINLISTTPELMHYLHLFEKRADRTVVPRDRPFDPSEPLTLTVSLPSLSSSSSSSSKQQQQQHPVGDLGFGMRGFPPSITSVAHHSPLNGVLMPGMTIEAVFIPNRRPKEWLCLENGAFTDERVSAALRESESVDGRIMIVRRMDRSRYGDKKSSRDAFDLGAFWNYNSWTFKKMFSGHKSTLGQKSGGGKGGNGTTTTTTGRMEKYSRPYP